MADYHHVNHMFNLFQTPRIIHVVASKHQGHFIRFQGPCVYTVRFNTVVLSTKREIRTKYFQGSRQGFKNVECKKSETTLIKIIYACVETKNWRTQNIAQRPRPRNPLPNSSYFCHQANHILL